MTKTPQIMTSGRDRPHAVSFVALPGVQLLDIVGPVSAFDAVNRVLAYSGAPPAYRLSVIGPERTVDAAGGLRLVTAPIHEAAPPDTLVVGGSLAMASQPTGAAVLEQLRRLADGAERVVSVCAGAFVLGELGLLDGRRCTTHWLVLKALRRRFPAARVEDDAIYTDDHPVYTSAGVTAGMDLALYVIERDLGAEMALRVARLLVVFLHRPGGQSQFGTALELRSGGDVRLRELVADIVDRPGEDHRVPELARRVGMSPRHFSRVFREQTGETPGAFVVRVRVEAARRALELSDRTTARIAGDCGFGTEETMRRAFHRVLGVPPSDYRRRFHRLRG